MRRDRGVMLFPDCTSHFWENSRNCCVLCSWCFLDPDNRTCCFCDLIFSRQKNTQKLDDKELRFDFFRRNFAISTSDSDRVGNHDRRMVNSLRYNLLACILSDDFIRGNIFVLQSKTKQKIYTNRLVFKSVNFCQNFPLYYAHLFVFLAVFLCENFTFICVCVSRSETFSASFYTTVPKLQKKKLFFSQGYFIQKNKKFYILREFYFIVFQEFKK